MSIERCARCSRQIDTDDDVDCYVPVSPEDVEPFCERCRDKMEAEREAEVLAMRAEYDRTPLSERNPQQYRAELIAAGRGHLLHPED